MRFVTGSQRPVANESSRGHTVAPRCDQRFAGAALGLLLVLGAACKTSPKKAIAYWHPMVESHIKTVPIRCTAHELAWTAPIDLGWDEFPICRGMWPSSKVEALRLDVDRYPTVVEVHSVELLARQGSKFVFDGTQAGGGWQDVWFYPIKSSLFSLEGRVLRVDAEFSVPSYEAILGDGWQGGLRSGGISDTPRQQGGWRAGLTSPAPDRLVGLAFLPTTQFEGERSVGCPEGHVVWLDTEQKKAYAADVRRIMATSNPRTTGFLEALRQKGGRYAGMYVAEHQPWRETLAILDDSERPHGAFAHGLARGVVRMTVLHHVGFYPKGAWKDVDLDRVEATLGRWAMRELLAARLDPDVAQVLAAMQVRFPRVDLIPGAEGLLAAIRAQPWVSAPPEKNPAHWTGTTWAADRVEMCQRWLLGADGDLERTYPQPPEDECHFDGGLPNEVWREVAHAHAEMRFRGQRRQVAR